MELSQLKTKMEIPLIKEGEFINTCDILIILDNVKDNLSGLHEYCVSFSNNERLQLGKITRRNNKALDPARRGMEKRLFIYVCKKS